MSGSYSDHAVDADSEAQILATIERWLERDVAPHVMALEHADEYPHAMVELLRAHIVLGAGDVQKLLAGLDARPPWVAREVLVFLAQSRGGEALKLVGGEAFKLLTTPGARRRGRPLVRAPGHWSSRARQRGPTCCLAGRALR